MNMYQQNEQYLPGVTFEHICFPCIPGYIGGGIL